MDNCEPRYELRAAVATRAVLDGSGDHSLDHEEEARGPADARLTLAVLASQWGANAAGIRKNEEREGTGAPSL